MNAQQMLAIIYDITVYGTEVKGKGMKKNVRTKHSKKLATY